ncbi:type I polyketide synthase [Roseibium litorale]|uniref:SDR family oxidoreductase n=1 Tax=Roseibium litorale TaxID=2803841 RepID=A0ABR9CMH6_9HYPH|nr:type I polyketide synthase [Roseibium litorale]MBD8891913.1 SDR family oxidoreductase [Roseibium litorale]
MTSVGHIAICSLSCRFPDAGSPEELWGNLMDGRRSFRAIPPQRLPMDAYARSRIGTADSITPVLAGLLNDWHFDREAFLIPKAAFENTDLTHWLALQLASEALAAAGGIDRLDRARTAVVVANTLTGEFSRAAILRLRQPFLDELLEETLAATGAGTEAADRIREEFANRLKSAFPEPNEDSLAGGLANTIAGRIANHFDLKGGAYTVDGACSSSLLAVANAATLLRDGIVDTVITGAVDLSLDPFELVGFSRNGALSPTRMRVFDARSDGFWPGEGGAFSVFMRAEDARRRGFPIRAVLRGWGMSTDGSGGLTRPDSQGQLLAYRRAHEMADSNPADLAYVEAHGTGTAIGDPTEVTALAALREGASKPLPIGSVKANIGHTKAAAGFAGLVKTVMSLQKGGVPPHAGCEEPHAIFRETDSRLFPVQQAKAFGNSKAPLVGVSSFGFGGINLHVVLEGGERQTARVTAFTGSSLRGEQGAELFLFRAGDRSGLRECLEVLRTTAANLSLAELADAAANAFDTLGLGSFRLAFVARDARELCTRIDEALTLLMREDGAKGMSSKDTEQKIHIGSGARRKIGYLFSGQAAPAVKPSPVWLARFPFLRPLADALSIEVEGTVTDTAVAQPAITYANLAAMQVMAAFGVEAEVATGHSLGELAALAWAGSLEPVHALDLAARRGAVMAHHGRANGAMLRLGLSADAAPALADGLDCYLACVNGRQETVFSGSAGALSELSKRAVRAAVTCQPLQVSHAFHSPDMAAAVDPFRAVLANICFAAPARAVVSTVTGAQLTEAASIGGLLGDQLVRPVQFVRALDEMAANTSLFIELGPGSGLTRLANDHGLTALALDSQSDDLVPLLSGLAAAFAAGHDIDRKQLLAFRGIRSIDLGRGIEFLSNPCGRRADRSTRTRSELRVRSQTPAPAVRSREAATLRTGGAPAGETLIQAVLGVVAEETGLPVAAIDPEARFQSQLHLNSLAVTRIVVSVCKRLGRQPVRNPTDFAEASPAILAAELAELAEFQPESSGWTRVNGVRRWVADYGIVWRACGLPKPGVRRVQWAPDPSIPETGSAADLGLLIDLPSGFAVVEALRLIERLQQAERQGIRRLAVIHDHLPVSSLFRSLFQERAFEAILLIDRNGQSPGDPRIDDLLRLAPDGFADHRLANQHIIDRAIFEPQPQRPARPTGGMPGPKEIVLAVGCHRGIGAECAFSLAADGAPLVLVGRSNPTDRAVTNTLAIARSRGIEARYEQCDVTDPSSVAELAQRLNNAVLEPSVLLFAPAVNEPMRLGALTAKSVRSTLAPKVEGLTAVLDRFGSGLHQVIAFGSIIGRIGLEGESHYALANAMQSRIVEDFAEAHPACRCLSLEWTVWGGAGMGERLGTIERLAENGVDALSFEAAMATFCQHVSAGTSGTIVITGRFGPPKGLEIGSTGSRPLRFVDRVLIDFPGTELVVETDLNAGRDLFLADHRIDGRTMLPGVIGIEAMAQVVATLIGGEAPRRITDSVFHRAAIVGRDGLRIRIAALRAADASVEACIFTQDDDFQSPCFSARFHSVANLSASPSIARVGSDAEMDESTSATLLYGPLFFHGPRFRKLHGIERVSSRGVDARLTENSRSDWFGAFEPAELLLGDPGVADAALHVLQVTIPHRRVLPLSIGEFVRLGSLGAVRRFVGVENWTRGDIYSFDVEAFDDDARLVAAWRDAQFKAIGDIDAGACLQAAPLLFRPYLERIARAELGDDSVRVAFVRGFRAEREQRRVQALRALGLNGKVKQRVDGSPMLVTGEGFLGLSHGAGVSLAVHGSHPIACDVTELGAVYPDVAGRSLTAEDWAQAEVLRKLGEPEPFALPLRAVSRGADPHRPVVFSRSLPALDLAVAIGTIQAAAASEPEPSRNFSEIAL